MRWVVIFFSLLIVGAGLFVVDQSYQSQVVFVSSGVNDPTSVLLTQLAWMRILGIFAAVLLAVVIYLVFSVHDVAGVLVYRRTREIAFSRDRLRRFYEFSPVPYLLITRKGLIARPNKASLRMFGLPEEQLLGKDIFRFLSLPDHAEKLDMYREQVQRGVPIEQKEVQVRNANGALRWALISIEDLTEPGSQDHSMLATLVDIHEQKELERIKTEFLSLASHQLRAPLANLKWYIDFLLKRRAQQLSAELAEYLHKMYRRNEDMIDLVNTLLNLSRIEMGRIKVEKQQTDVSALARSVIEELETVAADKQITLSTTFEGPEQFETDGRLVRIILQNLLTNALRYTPAGGKVELRTAGGAQSMTISVSDTGVGIPPEEQDKIFAKMYRASNAQAMEANGNGIGLYMCKALAEGMGGSIAFTSALNKGTTFTVTLER